MTNHSSTPQERAIVRRQLDAINAQQDSGGIARYQQGQQGPIQVHIIQQPAQPAQEPRRGPSTYETLRSQGEPEQLPSMRLPGLLQLTMTLIVITLFTFSASMLSIALTSYSNSVDRVHNNRRSINVR